MRNASKMARYMMMRTGRENGGDMQREGHKGDYTRGEYGGGMTGNYARYEGGMQDGGYEPENRFRDRRGREHYDNGRYAPQSAYMPAYHDEGEIESRRGQRRGRDGRYRAEGNGGMRSAYDGDDEVHRMNTIGFGDRDFPEPVWREGAYIGAVADDEMEHRKGQRMSGGAWGKEMELTPEIAEEWTKSMHNGDKTVGPHWSMEKTNQIAQQRGITIDPVEFFAIINAMYSDFYEVAKKHNVHNADFYADLAKAWLKDPDAVPNKAAMYYEYVVQHDD